MRERTKLDDAIGAVKSIEQDLSDTLEILELAEMDGDAEMETEAEEALKALGASAKEAELKALLSGEADGNETYIEIHAGAGGTEAQDWASMLFRLYLRWADSRGYKTETIQYMNGEEAGIKSLQFRVKAKTPMAGQKPNLGCTALCVFHRLIPMPNATPALPLCGCTPSLMIQLILISMTVI